MGGKAMFCASPPPQEVLPLCRAHDFRAPDEPGNSLTGRQPTRPARQHVKTHRPPAYPLHRISLRTQRLRGIDARNAQRRQQAGSRCDADQQQRHGDQSQRIIG